MIENVDVVRVGKIPELEELIALEVNVIVVGNVVERISVLEEPKPLAIEVKRDDNDEKTSEVEGPVLTLPLEVKVTLVGSVVGTLDSRSELVEVKPLDTGEEIVVGSVVGRVTEVLWVDVSVGLTLSDVVVSMIDVAEELNPLSLLDVSVGNTVGTFESELLEDPNPLSLLELSVG